MTEESKSLIDVALTSNENIIHACDVMQSAISDHSLVGLSLKSKTPRPRISFVTTRSYKNYDHDTFIEDLANVPFHIVNLFDDLDGQVHALPNPLVSTEIKGSMNTRDMWHKRAKKTNDKLHWNAYRHFRQEVKREIRLAEKEHVRSEILKSNGNTNSIWKILNRYIPRKNTPLATVENPLLL